MEHNGAYLHTPRPSSSSAIDLPHTLTGFATSAPPSPSLEASDSRGSFARRRTSWGHTSRQGDEGLDSLQLRDLRLSNAAGLSSSGIQTSGSQPIRSAVDDLFHTTEDCDAPFPARYGSPEMDPSSYTTSHSGPSTASLIPPHEFEMETRHREDDEAHLTANMSRNGMEDRREDDDGADPEGNAAMTPRSRRRGVRYSLSPSPLKKTGTAIKSMTHNLRRASIRVVNLAATGLESQIRLGNGDDEETHDENAVNGGVPLRDLSKALPIRGRTLCCFGSESKVRLTLFNFLVYPWTEPILLLLIIVNAVILTIQAIPPLKLATSDGKSLPPAVKGYFHGWEDYMLFVLFIIFTLEAFARICVSGFLFDPEVSLTAPFRSPSQAHSEPYPTTPYGPPHSAAATRFGSLSRGPLHRGNTITRRLSRYSSILLRPFTLAPVATSPYANTPYANTPYANTPAASAVTLTNSTSRVPQTAIHCHSSKSTYLSNILRSGNSDVITLPFQLSMNNMRDKARRNLPYLRQSWTRIDFVAIISFWITFALAMSGLERGRYHIGIFRAMSVIRTARLLSITSGTTTIMHSLKTARPLLARVAYFVLFAMAIFSIIGIQSFKGSLRRTCTLVSTLGESNITLSQFCGGYIDPNTLTPTSYVTLSGNPSGIIKGYICPLGQVCMEQQNPYNNVESFDAIYFAVLQVIITAAANGWSPLMYSMADAEFFVSCLFFIICIIVLNFWLINLFVAVITHTFSAIRSQTQLSAFGAAPPVTISERDEDWAVVSGRKASKVNAAKTFYESTRWCWVLLALASLALQATRTAGSDSIHEHLMSFGELGITIAFDFEILLRVIATLPDWRSFFNYGNNWLDTILAIGSSIIQIPSIHNSTLYPWFTIFQLARFYRVILVVPRMRPLLLAVFGNMYALTNMTLFLFLVNYISALAAVQLLRGDVGQNVVTNFGEVFNSFLSVYQVFSSENWPTVLYAAINAESQLGQIVVVTVFLTGWMLFSNFIVLQMFIAVINENFDVAEESKRSQQASTYWATHQPQTVSSHWLRYLNPYRWLKAKPVTVKVENLPSNLVLPMKKSLVQDHNSPRYNNYPSNNHQSISDASELHRYILKLLGALERLFAGETRRNDVPLAKLRHARRESLAGTNRYDGETERHLELLAAVNPDIMASEDMDDALYEHRAQRADFIRDHPTYDKTFWIFSQKNWLRKLCQRVVRPAHRERIFGTPYSPIAHPIFQLVVLLAVIGGIVVEIIASPIYRRNYFISKGYKISAWFEIAEVAFGFTLVLEFLIKIVADGFLFTPNAYIHSIWNVIDFIIMVGILVSVSTELVVVGGMCRFTRALKALRALRLITLIEKMRNTFQSLIISGALRILDAAVLAILYMIPYAVWGLNIFAGKMNTCNDTTMSGISTCTGEYLNTIYGQSFGFLTPRAWDNPSPSTTFSFDDFRSSLLILFEIVSLEGWIDVMWASASVTGEGQQPSSNASQGNALFVLIYNLLGGIVIMTLFVSIIIGNFKAKTGSAFLTAPQRDWIDLQKLFRRQKPSKRPSVQPTNYIRAWCFDRAVHKHGWWARGMTFFFVLHIIALMTQTFTPQSFGDKFRNDFFLGMMFIYVIDVAVRWFGLGWTSFRANGWNLFDIIAAGGGFVTTLVVRFGTNPSFALDQLQKLFLVSIAFKLVQKNNSLNMLFKTSVASLPVILNLLGLWLVVFLFFAILKVEVFSMTKWGSGETRNQNYSTMSSALVMLSFMSVGEGWNQYMHNYFISYPRCTNPTSLMHSDCGSESWALSLFIAWNLLSMYIFVNMFTGVVVENFSYVFQTSTGGAKSITREQMRAFKKVWAEFANAKTGYLEQKQFVRFFARLSGVFEVKIYPSEYSIKNLTNACRQSQNSNTAWVVEGLDLGKLESLLNGIDYPTIRQRRAIYSRLYHEAIIAHEPGHGISFNDMLLLLAHHILINDGEALVLKDLVVRTETNKLVTDLVNLDRVRSLLKTISCRRQFLAYREHMRQKEIPSIVVDTLSEGSPRSPSPSVNNGYDTPGYRSQPGSPTPHRRFGSSDLTLAPENISKLQRSSRRASDLSAISTEFGYALQRTSMPVEADPQTVLTSMQNSIWGDLMLKAAEEEQM